jgi:eukaryotic-like serine/threonine-protein kinase
VHHGVHRAMTMSATTTGGSSTKHSTMTRLAVKAGPWVSWRRVAIAGAISMSALAFFVLVFMLMRAYGIGPAGSLLASGKLDAKDRLLVADFRATGPDTSLGSVVTEAVRTDLGQSSTISLVSHSAVSSALQRMQRPDSSRLDVALARELAQREGLGAVVDGDIRPVGSGFVLTLRLIAAQSGDALATYQETVADTKELLPAVDKLTLKLRGKIGESLKAVRATRPLEAVTTRSLAALREYDLALRAQDVEYNLPRAISLYKSAIALDTEFAMAYRRLGTALRENGSPKEECDSAFARAYRYRDRLTDVERNLAIGSYFWGGPGEDRSQAASSLSAILDVDSLNANALMNLAYLERSRRNFARSELLFQRMLESVHTATDSLNAFGGLIWLRVAQSKLPAAAATLTAARRAFPNDITLKYAHMELLYAQGQEDSATLQLEDLRKNDPDAQVRAEATLELAQLALLHGRVQESLRMGRDAALQNEARGIPISPYLHDIHIAWDRLWYAGQSSRAVAEVDDVLRRIPIHSVKPSLRMYFWWVSIYAIGGRPERARAMLNLHRADVTDSSMRRNDEFHVHNGLAEIALAEGRPLDALGEFQLQDRGPDGPLTDCAWCMMPNYGRAYDLANMPDSTVAMFERFLAAPRYVQTDADYLAGIHKRLGELYEARGELAKAVQHYQAFIDLWRDADPELQPKVIQVRQRLAHLRESERR